MAADTKTPNRPDKPEFPSRASHLTMCSFCGRSHAEVTWLISGPGTYICDKCVKICASVLAVKGCKLVINVTQNAVAIARLGVKSRLKKLTCARRDKHI